MSKHPHHESVRSTLLRMTHAPDALTPLDVVVNLLQGDRHDSGADAGIARLPTAQLQRIAHQAECAAEACLDRVQCGLTLLERHFRADGAERPELLHLTRQLSQALAEHQRWGQLAGNAAYYRDHPAVAERVASFCEDLGLAPAPPPPADAEEPRNP